eukprot:IDg4967t1
MNMFNPGVLAQEANRVMIASTFLNETAAIWWYTLIQGGTISTTWDGFCLALNSEFVPAGHIRMARDKLRKLKQSRSVAKYLTDFRNFLLVIPDMTEGEKLEKFADGLKNELRLKVLKISASTLEEAVQVALRVDGAIWSASDCFRLSGTSMQSPTPTLMEIGNLEAK